MAIKDHPPRAKLSLGRFAAGLSPSNGGTSNKLVLVLLPTLFAVMAMIGRSIYHSSFDNAVVISSDPMHHVHRLATEKKDKETVQRRKTSAIKIKNNVGKTATPNKKQLRSSNDNEKSKTESQHQHNMFNPTKRDLHVSITDAKLQHPYLSHNLKQGVGMKRELAVKNALSGSACELPSAMCDVMYATAMSGLSADLYKIDILTGDEVRVGSIGYAIDGMAFDATTNTIYGNTVADDTGFSHLITIDPCTGVGTGVGSSPTGMGLDSDGLAIDSKGDIYAWSPNALVKINKVTGVATQIGRASVADVHNLAFDDCDKLHLINTAKDHYYIDVATGTATFVTSIVGNSVLDYVHGDILPGSKLLYSPFAKDPNMQVVNLDDSTENITLSTSKNYFSSTFVCDRPDYPDYNFDINKPGGFNVTGPGIFDLYMENGKKVPKFPPTPDHTNRIDKSNGWIELLKDCVKNAKVKLGGEQVRYELPQRTDFSIDFVYFMQIALNLKGDGAEARVTLKVFRHDNATSSVNIINSSPVLRHNGLIFFVPLQPGNHTVQVLDGMGRPIEDSPDCAHAKLDVTTFPCNKTAPPPVETESPTASPTSIQDFEETNENCPLDEEVMDAECDKEGSNTWGDPHLITFDKVKFDCQTLGDHVISKSRNTGFEIQARYGKPHFRKEFLSWMIGVAVNEGTPGIPLVEISLDTPFDSKDGSIKSSCAKTILVDGKKVTGDLTSPSATGTKGVWLKESRSKKDEQIITVSYWSGLVIEVKERQRDTFGCSLTTDFKVPLYMRDNWDLYGLLGSPDGIKANDWVVPDGSILPIPGSGKRKVNAMAAAHYCRNWCLTYEDASLFDYSSVTRHEFNDWQNCSAGPKSTSIDENDVARDAWLKFIEDVNDNRPEVITSCAATAADEAKKGNTRFDQQDCIVELVGGATITDVLEDQAALVEGDLQTTGIAACGDRTKSNCVKEHGANELLTKKAQMHSIACCIHSQAWAPVMGVSVVDSATGQCLEKGNYNAAHDACAAIQDGRLCTLDEVTNLVLKGSQGSDKCDLSTSLVWTSSLPQGKLEIHHWKVCGTNGSCGKPNGALVDANLASEKAKVRCCSNHAIAGWQGPKCGLWSASDFDGQCSGDVSYDDAVKFCLSKGGYLCSKKDLENDCTQGSGCGYDREKVWAMDTGMVEIKQPPKEDPEKALDAEQKRWLACGDKTALGCYRDEGAYEIVAAESSLHEVRCCKNSTTDLSSEGWTNNEGCPNIWAKSQVSSVGDGCVYAATYASAAGYCQAAGGVVCEKDWVSRGCTANSGCNHDSDLVWTSTIVDEAKILPTPMSWVTCGAKSKCTGNFGRGAFLSPHNKTHEVRCCSANYKPGWKKNKGCHVWGESDVPICYHAETYEDAKMICSLAGARLCTKSELIADCTRGSGCGHDRDFVWTMDRGWDIEFEVDEDTRSTDSKYWLACGDVDNPDCVQIEGTNEHLAPESEEHQFLCCSDDNALEAPWAVENSDSCNVMTTSTLEGNCFEPANYARAKQICAASGNGGRLCTRKELLDRCAVSAAKSCKLDGHLLWTSEGHDESTQGALQELRWLSCGNKGTCTELHGKGSRMEDHTSEHEHEVRCCSDYPMPGWRKKEDCPWTESDINGVCVHANTYLQAAETCASVGARLCEKDELIRTCTQGSGCSHDYDLIWSKTPAFKPPAEVVQETKAYLACGNSDNGKCEKYEGAKEAISSSLDEHAVRCCSSVQFDETWLNNADAKCSGVFAKSNVPVCYRDATLEEARGICAKYTDANGNAARLCTKQEILDGCADNSGTCGLDDDLVWTDDLIWTNDEVNDPSVQLVEKKWVVCGSHGGACEGDTKAVLMDHTDVSIVAAVRCCANHYVAGWRDPKHCPGIWSESDLPTADPTLEGDCHITYYDKAVEICAGFGARLCTKAELVSNCAGSGGCGFDHAMTWSKESGYEIGQTTLKAST